MGIFFNSLSNCESAELDEGPAMSVLIFCKIEACFLFVGVLAVCVFSRLYNSVK